jgi:hypothetical protein
MCRKKLEYKTIFVYNDDDQGKKYNTKENVLFNIIDICNKVVIFPAKSKDFSLSLQVPFFDTSTKDLGECIKTFEETDGKCILFIDTLTHNFQLTTVTDIILYGDNYLEKNETMCINLAKKIMTENPVNIHCLSKNCVPL